VEELRADGLGLEDGGGVHGIEGRLGDGEGFLGELWRVWVERRGDT